MSYILVVDDDPGVSRLLRQVLSSIGYEVVQAANGPEALAHLAERRPALIVLDVHLPVMSGWDVLQTLQADPTDALIPVVLITGDPAVRSHHAGSSLGVADVLHKPFRPAQLMRLVREILA